jgi:hypothetical protein
VDLSVELFADAADLVLGDALIPSASARLSTARCEHTSGHAARERLRGNGHPMRPSQCLGSSHL